MRFYVKYMRFKWNVGVLYVKYVNSGLIWVGFLSKNTTLGRIVEQRYDFGTNSWTKIWLWDELLSKNMPLGLIFEQKIWLCKYFHRKYDFGTKFWANIQIVGLFLSPSMWLWDEFLSKNINLGYFSRRRCEFGAFFEQTYEFGMICWSFFLYSGFPDLCQNQKDAGRNSE